MDTSRNVLAIAAALFVMAGAPPANSQSKEMRAECNSVGAPAAEFLSKQPGNVMQVTEVSCRWQGGDLDGLMMTATTIWAFENGVDGTLVAGTAIFRKPGAVAVFDQEGGKISMKMENGVQTDWSGNGTGVYKLAAGSVASLQGKKMDWTGKFTAPEQFVLQASFK